MERNEFLQMYRDPRWQRKRLELCAAANWACQMCDARDKELQIHHGCYESDKAPWEYDDETLHVVCSDCHEQMDYFRKWLVHFAGHCSFLQQCQLAGYLLAMLRLWKEEPDTLGDDLRRGYDDFTYGELGKYAVENRRSSAVANSDMCNTPTDVLTNSQAADAAFDAVLAEGFQEFLDEAEIVEGEENQHDNH